MKQQNHNPIRKEVESRRHLSLFSTELPPPARSTVPLLISITPASAFRCDGTTTRQSSLHQVQELCNSASFGARSAVHRHYPRRVGTLYHPSAPPVATYSTLSLSRRRSLPGRPETAFLPRQGAIRLRGTPQQRLHPVCFSASPHPALDRPKTSIDTASAACWSRRSG